jgi:uncharacterized protein
MNKITKYILLFFIVVSFVGTAQTDCFPKPVDFKFVYDEADALSSQQETALNNKLRAFTQNTSNVLVIVIPNDLCGYDKAKYTYTCLEEMGVGRADLDNGLVLMVKPKELFGRGETFIATGKGLQGAIPDLTAKRIVDREMIPQFKRKNYYQGIENASNVLISLASGEISEKDYSKKDSSIPFVVFVIIFVILFILAQKYGKGGDDWEDFGSGGKRGGRSSLPWWIAAGGMSGGSSRGGSGGFGGGGFGGFGGGGSFGGGAGGSW